MIRNRIPARLSVELLGLFLCCSCTQLSGGEALPSSGLATMNKSADSSPAKEGTVQMSDEVTVSYSLADTHLSLHEPVILNLAVKNGSQQPVTLDLGQDRKEAFSITVTRPDGQRVQLPPLQREGISLIGTISLAAQQTYTQHLLLDEWYKFDAPGTYEVGVRLANPVRSQSGAMVQEPSEFSVKLEIGARDVERLKQRAESLAARASNKASYEEAAEAALTLGHITDPVAVPYLEQVLTANTMVRPIVIKGLERNASSEAVRVLASMLDDPAPEVVQMSRSALANIGRKSPDPEVREQIKRALSKQRATGTPPALLHAPS